MIDTVDRKKLDDWLYAQTKGVVQSGPFKGMLLSRTQGWVDGAIGPQLLGCHEEELHASLEQEIVRLESLDNPKIVNVGCAEGYYAIGLARRLPKATVWAIDNNDTSLEIAKQSARDNGVNIVIGDTLDHVFAAPDLIVMDCEGAEVGYLDCAKFPSLKAATIIVELHSSKEQETHAILYDRFDASHVVGYVREGARDPNKYEMLQPKSSAFRWAAICENRPVMMYWYVMRPK